MQLVRRTLLLLSLACALTSPAMAQVDRGRYEANVAAALANDGAPGAAIVLVQPGSAPLFITMGPRAIGERAVVDENTLFGIGSLTKAFAAATAAILVDEQRINWDTLVRDVYPALTLNDERITEQFTMRDMLSGRYGVSLVDEIFFRTVSDDRDVYLSFTSRLPARSRFRDRFVYSNAMYTTTGAVVGHIEGRSWDDVVEARLFRPLGMSRTTSLTPRIRRDRNRAEQHLPAPQGGMRVMAWDQYGREAGGASGSIYSSAADMAAWLQMQLNLGAFNGTQVISAQRVRDMHTPQTTLVENGGWLTIARNAGYSADPLGYGFGWYNHSYRGQRLVHHSGGQGGYISYAAMLPDSGFGVIVLLNGRSGKNLNLALALAAADAFIDGAAPSRIDWPQELARIARPSGILTLAPADVSARQPDLPMSTSLDAYAGAYTNATVPDGLIVRLENGELSAHLGLMHARLTHWHGDTFLMHVADRLESPYEDLITFRLDGRRQVIGLSAQRTLGLQNMARRAQP